MRDDLIVVPVFSRGRLGPTRVVVPTQSGEPGVSGVLFCEEITTIDRDFLAKGPVGAPMPPGLMEEVVRGVRRAIGEAVPEPD